MLMKIVKLCLKSLRTHKELSINICRIFLKEFCVEFLLSAYNQLMNVVKGTQSDAFISAIEKSLIKKTIYYFNLMFRRTE
jgi:hypothetical protein